MKKFFSFLILFFLVVFSFNSFAATTVVNTSLAQGIYKCTFTCGTDSAGSATYAAKATPFNIDGWVMYVITNPGSTGPTDDYDITLTDDDGVDIMGGALLNRDITNSEQAAPLIATGYYRDRYVSGPLTLTITNNSVNNATTVVTIYYRR
jgi:hypothetical protein